MGLIVIIFAAFSIFAALIARYRNPDKKLDPQFWMSFGVVVATVVLLAGFPFVVIFMASNGSIDIFRLRYVEGWADRVAVVCDISIPCFLVLFPSWLSCLAAMGRSQRKEQESSTSLARSLSVGNYGSLYPRVALL